MSQLDYKASYHRNLPHIQPPGATLFVTFRLAGSLPRVVIAQWQKEQRWLSHLAKTNPSYHRRVKDDFERKWFAKFEEILDGAAVGPVWLRDEPIAAIVADSLHHRHGKAYRLDAFSIMGNHVHAVIKPLSVLGDEDLDQSISAILQSLKGYTSFKCNRVLGREGEFWAHESYDHWNRDNDEWHRIVAYVLNNPVKAGCVKRWQDWRWNYRRA
ncbi:MAG: REP-associated tyrosine transposase [Pyrinomonadaceae bacterium]|jgi:REP element-mobilizing transposase RayT|nr:REP-associated tyrosine transposase [Pyrinomonadaceae bacterium]